MCVRHRTDIRYEVSVLYMLYKKSEAVIDTFGWYLPGPGGNSAPPFLFMARRPLVTGDIIISVGLVYLTKWSKKEQLANT